MDPFDRLVQALKDWDWSGLTTAGVQVIGGPAEVVVPPAVSVIPDDPYLEPSSYCDWVVRLRVPCYVARADAPGALDLWRAFAKETWRAVTALRGAVALSAGRIQTVPVGDAELLVGSVAVRMEEKNHG